MGQLIFHPPITKTYVYNFDSLKPHFYIVKLGFAGVYIIFLFLLKIRDCGYSLEPPRWGGSNEYHNLCFEQKYEKYQSFSSQNFQFLEVKFSLYLNRRVFAMIWNFSYSVWGHQRTCPMDGHSSRPCALPTFFLQIWRYSKFRFCCFPLKCL